MTEASRIPMHCITEDRGNVCFPCAPNTPKRPLVICAFVHVVRTSTKSCFFSETRTNEVEYHHFQHLSYNLKDHCHHHTAPPPGVNTKGTWDVPESFDNAVVLMVDDAGPLALDSTAVPHLALAGTHTLRGVDLRRKGYCVSKAETPLLAGASRSSYLQVRTSPSPPFI